MFQGSDAEARRSSSQVLVTCLHAGLRLLHPFMPFLTEELYQRLPLRPREGAPPTICLEAYPEPDEVRRGGVCAKTRTEGGEERRTLAQSS